MIFKSVINGSIEDLSGGLSGCRLSISADGKIVSKYSSGLGYNYRLLEQAKKQEYFKTLQIENIKCPTVLSINSKSDLCFFEMEYIAGGSHLDFLEYSSPLYISAFIDSIFYYFNFVSEGKLESYSNKEFIFLCRKKLESIKDRVPYPGFVEYLVKYIIFPGFFLLPRFLRLLYRKLDY